jgi:uncharacterized protein (DUF2062 family)
VSWPAFLSQIRHNAFELVRGVFVPMLVGATLFGIVCGGITYCVVVRLVDYYRGKLAG